MTVFALALWGCGGDEGSGGKGGSGGAAGRGGSGGSAARGGSGGSTGGAIAGAGGSTAGTGGGNAGTGGRGGGNAGTGGGNAGTGGGNAGTGGGTAGTGGGNAGTGGGNAGTGGGNAGTGGGNAGTGGGNAGTGGGNAGTGGGTAGTGGTSCTNGTSCTLPGTGGAAGGAAINGVCANGVCSNCGADSACQTAYGNSTNSYICLGTGATATCVAGNCEQNSECNMKICNQTTHFCADCANDMNCTDAYGANHLCTNGTCVAGSCRNNNDCGAGTGQICNSSATCVSCNGVDAACTTAYGAGFICVSNSCVMGTCHDDSGCTATPGQICTASHVCGGCGTNDALCGSGRICEGGLCVTGNCHNSSACSNGQVCLNNSCANCTVDTQCASGQLCLSGGCTTGNCRVASTDCNGGQVCLSNVCATCANDGQCASTANGYGPDHLCNGSGACVQGNCRVAGNCASSGTICNTGTMFCRACAAGAAGDTECQTEYNSSAFICNGGVCISGNCHSTANCMNGQICNLSNHTCEGCAAGAAGDTACADAANYGANHICQGGQCITGTCHVAGDCNDTTKICSGNQCGACSTTAECTTAYGANHVCIAGACVTGNCNSTSDCVSSKQICNTTTHACESCTTDLSCTQQTQYGAMHICLGTGNAAQCVPGDCHDRSQDCTSNQICGITTPHVCGSCNGSDTACKADPFYTSGSICLSNQCLAGDCHDSSIECSAGKVCGASTPHTCGNCAADTQCSTDARYGTGNICFQGLCGVGDCHATSADCSGTNAGKICGASGSNVCGPCTSDSSCTSDTFYGPNTICSTGTGKCVTRVCSNNNQACTANTGDFCCGGSCTPGNCCVDADCGAIGQACINHTCSACNAVSGNTFYVDPVNGNDTTGTGSNMSGATPAPGCAFKTITRAIAILGASPFPGTKIVLVGSGTTPRGLAAGDSLPITIPTNTTLTTTGGPITITLATTAQGNDAGFRLNNNASGISGDSSAPLVLDGNNFAAGIAVRVNPGTTSFTSSIANVTIRQTNGDAIRVNAGTLTVGAGVVQAFSNQDGLRVQGGTANVTNPSGAQTSFQSNVSHGIETSGNGTVTITGTRGAPVPSANGTVLLAYNTQAGLRINPTSFGAGGTAGLNDINGVVAWGNTNRDMIVYAGSKFRMRNSVLGAGPEGIRIQTNGATDATNDISQIDLGTTASFGNNYIQMPNGSLGFHTSAGICVNLAGGHPAQNLFAAGNIMTTTGNPGTQLDCSMASGTVAKGANCNANSRWSVGNATPVTTPVANVLDMCN